MRQSNKSFRLANFISFFISIYNSKWVHSECVDVKLSNTTHAIHSNQWYNFFSRSHEFLRFFSPAQNLRVSSIDFRLCPIDWKGSFIAKLCAGSFICKTCIAKPIRNANLNMEKNILSFFCPKWKYLLFASTLARKETDDSQLLK